MISPWLLVLLIAGKTDVWTEPSVTKVFPDSAPGIEASTAVRIYAARGEFESFQVCVQAGKKPVTGVQLRPAALDKQIGAPEVRRVAYAKVGAPSARPAFADKLRWPDPLLDVEPFDIPARETRALWVTYEIPRDTKPGIHTGEIELVFNSTIKQAIAVTIEVFDFELPETPSLGSLFALDREAVGNRYGIHGNALDDWKPIYDALKAFPISYSLAANGDLLSVAKDGSADTTAFREHLDYVMAQCPMNTIDLGMGESGISPFPEPLSKSQADPLEPFLRGMADWLAERNWIGKACVMTIAPRERYRWPDTRATLERTQKSDSRVRRLVAGPLHPYWERYTDIWAAPLAGLEPGAVQRLRQGRSLSASPAIPAEVSASTAGVRPETGVETTARDAYDGSPYTAWCSAGSPSSGASEWLRLDFAEAVKLSSLSVIWQTGLEATDIQLETSFDGERFSSATTEWKGHDARGPGAFAWTEGTLAMEKTVRALRLTFLSTVSPGPVGVREVVVGTPSDNAPETQLQAPALWLDLSSTDFPCLGVDAGAGEIRLIPWVCWANGLRGILPGYLNHWPRTWDQAFLESGNDWDGNDQWSGTLVYPGPHRPLPSIRFELLRDAIEDYEYLAAADDAVRSGRLTEAELRKVRPEANYVARPSAANVAKWTKDALAARVRLGRLLTQRAKEGTWKP